jgi:hypothetical protein
MAEGSTLRRAGGIPKAGRLVALLAMSLLAGGCSNEDAVLGVRHFDPPASPQISLAQDIQPIFTSQCALSGCHGNSFPDPVGLILSAGNSFGNLVNVPSVEAQGLLRVKPGESAASYLIHKLEGTQASVGGGGAQMPFGAAPLPDAEIDVIRRWIDQGAQDN